MKERTREGREDKMDNNVISIQLIARVTPQALTTVK